MTEISQNGWPVLEPDSQYLYDWVIPASTGEVTLQLHRGPAGFVLCHYILWHAEKVETVAGAGDDFGYSHRQIAGSSDWSNHASGTAADLNASAHPQATHTYSDDDIARIHLRLETYGGAIKWGGDFHTVVDQMHFENQGTPGMAKTLATTLVTTSRGRRLLKANPSQRKFVA